MTEQSQSHDEPLSYDALRAELEAELDAEQPDDAAEALYNTVRKATLVERGAQGATFDLGDGQRAHVPAEELAALPDGEAEVELLVEDRAPDGTWQASLWKARALGMWRRVGQLARQKASVDGEVIGANDGGLIVDVEGMRGFVPMSQIALHRVEDAAGWIGRKETFQVVDFDRRRGDVILSRRVLQEAVQAEKGKALAESLEVGQVHDGIVRSVMPYGAFVDIGGLEGLLHDSNLSWDRGETARNTLKPGQPIRVKVLEFDPGSQKIALGTRQLLADPWAGLAETFPIGSTQTGRVVNLAKYGAFVELAPGIEGLVHVSEMSWTENVRHPKQVVSVGDEVEVQVLEIDLDNRRIRLSRRRLQPNPWATFAAEHEVGARLTGKVARFAKFGVFVELAPGIDGLLHVKDISWTERIDDPSTVYEAGQEIEVVLLSLDAEAGRASLGVKQLSADPWTEAEQLAVPGQKIEVEIVRLVPFGAFAKIAEGVEGLIHISNLREERVEDAAQVVSIGKKVEALVLSFDRKKQRIGLSLKHDALPPEFGGESAADSYEDEGQATTSMADLFKQQDD